MGDARLRGTRRFQVWASSSLLMLAGACAFWPRQKTNPAPDPPPPGSIPSPLPATYQTVTTTLGDPAIGSASELTWTWLRDDNGRIAEVVGPGGVTTRISHSAQPATRDDQKSGERHLFVRDARGRLLRAEGPSGQIAINYGADGLPREIVSDGAPTVRYTSDVFGRLATMRIGYGVDIGYRYDYLGRLAAVATPAGEITFTYHAATNTLVRRLPNGVETIRRYDDEGRLVELSHVDPRNYVLAGYVYTYRPDGLIEIITESNQRDGTREWRYAYDAMRRLIAVDAGAARSAGYRYDAQGNLIESRGDNEAALRFTNTPAGALATDSRGPVDVDTRGHLRRRPTAGALLEYDFTAAGDLAAIKRPDVRYAYNALGLLTARIVDGRATLYLPNPFADAWQPIWERDPEGTETVTIWDGAVPLVQMQGNRVTYRLEDHLASTRVEVDVRGHAVAWHDYTPYGAPLNAAVGDALEPGFAGLFWDPAAQVYHAMARAYDPFSGRFLQPDPKLRMPDASSQSHSLYAYCGGDPVNFIDQNGAEARATRTIGFNRTARWWDSYFRALDYHTFGWMRTVLGTSHAPLVVVTAPDVRVPVVRQILNAARQRNFDLDGVDGDLKAWRTAPPPQLSGLMISEQEWQAAENYTTTLSMVNDFDHAFSGVDPALGPVGRGLGSAWMTLLAGVYFDVKSLLIPLGLPPITDKNAHWVASNFTTLKWQARAIVDAWSVSPIKSFWQWLDDVLVPSAYGDEIPEASVPASPSQVGGVYLGGVAKMLEGFGSLHGIAIDDASGQLALIGSEDQRIALPALRLEDIVTVFRAVYEHGQAPTVTIDPDPQEPTGPLMHVKHGPGTASTYVGWILFECDRVMKAYQLGRDNIAGTAVASRVPGYARTVDSVFFESGHAARLTKESWERFWIVPAEVRRFDAVTDNLSLFELSLKVNTQKMRWQRNELVDDPRAQSSEGARTFATWFSEHYDAIADEVCLAPPPESGISAPVAIFHELRRIATIAAAAERLRDLGRPMPTWMRDYPVTLLALPNTTPALRQKQTRADGSTIRAAQIYGGVNLAPADRDVQVYREGSESAHIATQHQAFVATSRGMTSWLAPAIADLARTTRAFTAVNRITGSDGSSFTVAVLPSASSRAVLANRQVVHDLIVPLGERHDIRLTRSYNSFFDPSGQFGRGWDLDLPEWIMTPVPVRRDGKHTEYRFVPGVRSPLGTTDIRFEWRETAKAGSKVSGTWTSPDRPEITGIGRSRSDITASDTNRVVFRDGTTWHFDDEGRLVLVEVDGAATRYVWADRRRLVQIIGYIDAHASAEIRLAHDERGRIMEARAAQVFPREEKRVHAPRVRFEYDEAARLVGVVQPPNDGDVAQARLTYTYGAHRLKTIEHADGRTTSFDYDDDGRLARTRHGKEKTEYAVVSTSHGSIVRSTSNGLVETWEFDRRLRPLKIDFGTGSAVQWRYGAGREVLQTHFRNGRPLATRQMSEDGSTETIAVADGPNYEVRNDTASRPVDVYVNGVAAAHVEWRPDGSLARLRTGPMEIYQRYGPYGRASGLLISAPIEKRKTTEWSEVQWDSMRRHTTITDSSGFVYRLQYDSRGRLQTRGRLAGDGTLVGEQISYDVADRVSSIRSSWRAEIRTYSDSGSLIHVEIDKQGSRSTTRFDDQGRPIGHVDFDGRITRWRYDKAASGKLPKSIELPNGGEILYLPQAADRTRLEVSLGTTHVEMRTDSVGRVMSLTWRSIGAECHSPSC